MSLHELPARPNLDFLKKQARLLLRGYWQADAGSLNQFREARVNLPTARPKLADALHVVALEYGFDTWSRLKAHVETLSEDPMKALTAAVKANDVDLLRQVLGRFPGLKSQLDEPLPDYGFEAPALMAAVNHGNREMVDVLLAAGANIDARSRWWAGGFGVLDSAEPELANYLIDRGAFVDIHAAVRLERLARVKELVESDATLVHARGGDGQMPLHFASSIEIAQYLLDRGAEVDARDIDHESTAAQYMVALRPRRLEVARYLISRGAQPDILMAAALGDLDLVRQLVDEDPGVVRLSVREKNFPKQDPRSGGTIYIYGFGWGKTPHALAHESGHEEVYRLLMQRSPLELRFAQACEVGDAERAREVLTRHPNVLQTLSPRASLRLLGVAVRNKTQAARMMLEAGWPVDVRGEQNHTPLHWAAWHGNVEMVRELLARQAPLEVADDEHHGTPLTWAFHGSEHGWHRNEGDYPGTVRLLLEAGAIVPESLEDVKATEEVLQVMQQHVR